MDTQDAKRALAQFDNWMRAASRVREVVENTEQMEQRAEEAAKRHKALETANAQLDHDKTALQDEIEALRQRASETKLAMEHETKRVKERSRKAREEAEQQAAEAERDANLKIEALYARLKAVEDECKERERKARNAATKAESALKDLRKRLGAV